MHNFSEGRPVGRVGEQALFHDGGDARELGAGPFGVSGLFWRKDFGEELHQHLAVAVHVRLLPKSGQLSHVAHFRR